MICNCSEKNFKLGKKTYFSHSVDFLNEDFLFRNVHFATSDVLKLLDDSVDEGEEGFENYSSRNANVPKRYFKIQNSRYFEILFLPVLRFFPMTPEQNLSFQKFLWCFGLNGNFGDTFHR